MDYIPETIDERTAKQVRFLARQLERRPHISIPASVQRLDSDAVPVQTIAQAEGEETKPQAGAGSLLTSFDELPRSGT